MHLIPYTLVRGRQHVLQHVLGTMDTNFHEYKLRFRICWEPGTHHPIASSRPPTSHHFFPCGDYTLTMGLTCGLSDAADRTMAKLQLHYYRL